MIYYLMIHLLRFIFISNNRNNTLKVVRFDWFLFIVVSIIVIIKYLVFLFNKRLCVPQKKNFKDLYSLTHSSIFVNALMEE